MAQEFSDDFRKQILSNFFDIIANNLANPRFITKLFNEQMPGNYDIMRAGIQNFFELTACDLAVDFFYTELLFDSLNYDLDISSIKVIFIDDCAQAIKILAWHMLPRVSFFNIYNGPVMTENYKLQLASYKNGIINQSLLFLEETHIFAEATPKESWLKIDGSQIFTNPEKSKKIKIDIKSSLQEHSSFTYSSLDDFLAKIYYFMFKLISRCLKANKTYHSNIMDCFELYILDAKPTQGCQPINLPEFSQAFFQTAANNPDLFNFENNAHDFFEETYRFKLGHEKEELMQNLASNFIQEITKLIFAKNKFRMH